MSNEPSIFNLFHFIPGLSNQQRLFLGDIETSSGCYRFTFFTSLADKSNPQSIFHKQGSKTSQNMASFRAQTTGHAIKILVTPPIWNVLR